MNHLPSSLPAAPAAGYEPTEDELRQDLAAAYRLIAHFGMTDTVYTHLSVRIPGAGNRFLVNPYGLLFEEITASSLVEVDAAGEPAQSTRWPVNPAGFVIHSAIHIGRPDAHCVMHTHTLAGMAVAAQRGGLLPLNQISMEFLAQTAVHDYEGVADDDNLSERERLVQDLGQDKTCLILRNHGLLTVGHTVAEAFYRMYYLEQTCRIQVAAQSTGAPLSIPSEHVQQRTAAQFENGDGGWLVWQALRRKLDREQPDYCS
jgi:ribulose-5-phosphate 4-epimerase/fuculose-1-phosphate aldolase